MSGVAQENLAAIVWPGKMLQNCLWGQTDGLTDAQKHERSKVKNPPCPKGNFLHKNCIFSLHEGQSKSTSA